MIILHNIGKKMLNFRKKNPKNIIPGKKYRSMASPRRIELLFSPWKGDVLTSRRWRHYNTIIHIYIWFSMKKWFFFNLCYYIKVGTRIILWIRRKIYLICMFMKLKILLRRHYFCSLKKFIILTKVVSFTVGCKIA